MSRNCSLVNEGKAGIPFAGRPSCTVCPMSSPWLSSNTTAERSKSGALPPRASVP